VGSRKPIPTIRAVVTHAHAIVRHGVIAALETRPDIAVTDGGENEDPIALLRRVRPDVVIAQEDGALIDGTHLIKAIDRHGLAARVILIAESWAGETLYRAFREGAAGFLTYRDPVAHILATVEQAANPGASRYLDPHSVMQNYLRHHTVGLYGRHDRQTLTRPLLTMREIEVLRYTARGYSIRETSRHLRMSVPTVKNHRHSIYSKLGVANAAAAVSRAWSYGYIP
jgi:DNA-binding NarL/FixJ family response regulator